MLHCPYPLESTYITGMDLVYTITLGNQPKMHLVKTQIHVTFLMSGYFRKEIVQ
jgi:hypothetical protein